MQRLIIIMMKKKINFIKKCIGKNCQFVQNVFKMRQIGSSFCYTEKQKNQVMRGETIIVKFA